MAAAAAGALVLAFVLLQSTGAASYTCDTLLTPPPSATSDPTQLGFTTSYLGDTHVPNGTPIDYDFCPPTSGNHYSGAGGPIRSAVYGAGSEQQPGGWVHNLEHGSIVVLYRCPSGTIGTGDCASTEEMSQLQQWFDNAPVVNDCLKQAVVARFDSMATRFGVLAWNRAMLLDEFDLGAASTFAQQWTDVTAPEAHLC